MDNKQLLIDPARITDGERKEMIKLGILSEDNRILNSFPKFTGIVRRLKSMLYMPRMY